MSYMQNISALLGLKVNRFISAAQVTPAKFGISHLNLLHLKVIYHPLYGMNNYVLIWGDWLSCDPLRGSHDSQPPHIRKHLCPILCQL